jgi:trimeric autotransporter adhesin
MNDDDLTTHDELASAYLDGDLDATQRAAVDADPATMARVESFRAVRAALKDVGPVVHSTRTAAVAAALAQFGAAAPVATAAATITQLSARRRPRSLQILTGVAAAAAVGVLGVAIARNSNNGDSKLSSAAPAASDAVLSAQKSASAVDSAAPAATTAAAAAAPASRGPTETTLVAIDTPAALVQYASSARSIADTAAPPSTAAPAASAAPPAPAAGEAVASDGASPCLSADGELLGTVSYQGTIAEVIRNRTTGAVQALATDDCRVLQTVQP